MAEVTIVIEISNSAEGIIKKIEQIDKRIVKAKAAIDYARLFDDEEISQILERAAWDHLQKLVQEKKEAVIELMRFGKIKEVIMGG